VQSIDEGDVDIKPFLKVSISLCGRMVLIWYLTIQHSSSSDPSTESGILVCFWAIKTDDEKIILIVFHLVFFCGDFPSARVNIAIRGKSKKRKTCNLKIINKTQWKHPCSLVLRLVVLYYENYKNYAKKIYISKGEKFKLTWRIYLFVALRCRHDYYNNNDIIENKWKAVIKVWPSFLTPLISHSAPKAVHTALKLNYFRHNSLNLTFVVAENSQGQWKYFLRFRWFDLSFVLFWEGTESSFFIHLQHHGL